MNAHDNQPYRYHGGSDKVKVSITVTREYQMDVKRIRRDFAEEARGPQTELDFLKEAFFELCGWNRDEDHVDGEYVWLIDEFSDDADFEEEADDHS